MKADVKTLQPIVDTIRPAEKDGSFDWTAVIRPLRFGVLVIQQETVKWTPFFKDHLVPFQKLLHHVWIMRNHRFLLPFLEQGFRRRRHDHHLIVMIVVLVLFEPVTQIGLLSTLTVSFLADQFTL